MDFITAGPVTAFFCLLDLPLGLLRTQRVVGCIWGAVSDDEMRGYIGIGVAIAFHGRDGVWGTIEEQEEIDTEPYTCAPRCRV